VEAAWDPTTLELIQEALEKYPEKADRVLRTKVRPYASKRVDSTLRKAPPPRPWSIEKPPPWTSNKQRGAYWHTKGFGKGIPTSRTNRHIRSWSVRADYKKKFGKLVIKSDDPVGQYKTGVNQQRFHRLAGWPHAPTVLEDIMIESEFVFVEGLLDILWEGIF
jgi:hypothetical protein